MLEIYLDLVILLNFSVDFLLLMGTNRLSGFPLSPGRCAWAAVLGAVYSGACLLPGFSFLGALLWRMVSLVGMSVLAFGWNRSAWKRGGVFVLLSLALGGAAMQFSRGNLVSLVLAAGGIWILCRTAFGSSVGGREYVPVTLSWGENSVSVLALRDTGNTLRDPITGEPVLVVSSRVGQRLTGLTQEQLASPLETMAQRPIPGLRLIPYQAVGQSGGMLLGLRLDQVKIDGKNQKAVAAFAPAGLSGNYQALVAVQV